MKTIKKINPLSAGSVSAIIMLVFMYLIIIPFALFFSTMGLSEFNQIGMYSFGGGLAVILFAPLLYAVFAFLGGVLSAAIYNWTFKIHKGYKIEFAENEEEIGQIGNS